MLMLQTLQQLTLVVSIVLSDIGASSITVTNNQLRSITISDTARLAIGKFNTAPEIEIVATAGSGAKLTPVMNYNNVVSYNSSFARVILVTQQVIHLLEILHL